MQSRNAAPRRRQRSHAVPLPLAGSYVARTNTGPSLRRAVPVHGKLGAFDSRRSDLEQDWRWQVRGLFGGFTTEGPGSSYRSRAVAAAWVSDYGLALEERG